MIFPSAVKHQFNKGVVDVDRILAVVGILVAAGSRGTAHAAEGTASYQVADNPSVVVVVGGNQVLREERSMDWVDKVRTQAEDIRRTGACYDTCGI